MYKTPSKRVGCDIGIGKQGEPWFHDGNIILVTEEDTTAFCIHRGVLARHSDVFQNMFDMPQPSSGVELFDGRQVVRVHDLPEDLSNLITALYDGPSFMNHNLNDFLYLAGILRLSTKYFIDRLRLQAIKHLAKTWSHTLSGHDEMVQTALDSPIVDNISYPYAHPLHILNLAKEVNVQILIPSAVYFLSLYPLNDLLRGDHPKLNFKHPSSPSSELQPEEIQKYTLMYQHRMDVLLYFIRRICAERSACPRCVNGKTCSRNFASLASRLSRSWQIRTGPFHYMAQAIEELNRDGVICSHCRQVFEKEVNTFRQKMWDELPSVIGLPPWQEMLDSDLS